MMNKLVILVLAFAIVAPALAEDIPEWYAPFRSEEGSTYSHWTYDDGVGVYDWDMPDSDSFVPVTGDPCASPYVDPCSGSFAAQVWGIPIDPCANSRNPWYDALPSDPCAPRQGGVSFNIGSWDINNFLIDNPVKDVWIQMTYLVQGGGSLDPCYIGAGTWVEGDPCDEEPWGWYEGDDYEAPISEWNHPEGAEPTETWMGGGGEEFWWDAEMVNRQTLTDGWIHKVWAMTLSMNPEYEWIEFGYADGTGILLDQIVIETLCYVPEPATMVLLGLGSLMMIRRKKK